MSQNENNEPQKSELNQEQMEAIVNWYQMIKQQLEQQFEGYEVEGQIAEHPALGPIFTFTLNHDGKPYTCGFFLSELLQSFQGRENPEIWLSSFFVDLMRSSEGRPLPEPPQSEDEAKTLVEQHIVPLCAKLAHEEFPDENLHIELGVHPEYGPVLEASIPIIKDGNNTCAMPLHYLYTLYLLNRDPAEPLVTAIYQLQEQLQQEA